MNWYRAPRPTQTPHVSILLDAMPASRADVAKYLGVSLRTLQRWEAAGAAPRVAMLALFWESKWGIDWFDCNQINTERMLRGSIEALRRQESALRARIARLEALGDFGSANAPLAVATTVAARPGQVAVDVRPHLRQV